MPEEKKKQLLCVEGVIKIFYSEDKWNKCWKEGGSECSCHEGKNVHAFPEFHYRAFHK